MPAATTCCGPRVPASTKLVALVRAYEAGREGVTEPADRVVRGPIQISGSQNAGVLRADSVQDSIRPGLRLQRGHVQLRTELPESTLYLYREVERAFRQRGNRGRFVKSLCQHFIEVWAPTLLSERAYESIYARDGYRCTSPVCRRHDVTPHHLKFRSKGGGDEPDNLTSLCVWCHLEGVHGGRITAKTENGEIHWRIGRVNSTVVEGRDKLVA